MNNKWQNYIVISTICSVLYRYVSVGRGVCNQNLYIEEEQTTQWPKEKVQKDKQWSIKHNLAVVVNCYIWLWVQGLL